MSLAEQLSSLTAAKKSNKIDWYDPYPWQREFHAAGASNPERLLCAGNRTGKTYCGASETTFHATGLYPDWWTGKRFAAAGIHWCVSITNETSRDIQQLELLGPAEDRGTGAIPLSCLGRITMRQAGVADVVDTVKVKHVSGSWSTIVFKSYDQGWRKFQGTAILSIWMDEEPDGNSVKEKKIFSECLARIITTSGVLFITLTPLLGRTDLIIHFSDSEARGVYMKTATWEDAPHLSKEETERILESFPDFEREARSKGIPVLGTGRVFQIDEKEIKCEPFQIPDYFFQIAGADFGIDHPAAGCWIAIDRDKDIIYVTDGYRKANETAVYHASAFNKRGNWIPVSWPHDGLQRGKADGIPLKTQYKAEGAFMLGVSARYQDDIGGGQGVEPIVQEVLERMRTGTLKVFSNQSEWFEEFRNLHRDDNGKIVAVRDDLMKAFFYAVMMRRYARQPHVKRVQEKYTRSMLK